MVDQAFHNRTCRKLGIPLNTPYAEAREDGVCEECGTVAELRPYGQPREDGSGNKNICCACGRKDPARVEMFFALKYQQ